MPLNRALYLTHHIAHSCKQWRKGRQRQGKLDSLNDAFFNGICEKLRNATLINGWIKIDALDISLKFTCFRGYFLQSNLDGPDRIRTVRRLYFKNPSFVHEEERLLHKYEV